MRSVLKLPVSAGIVTYGDYEDANNAIKTVLEFTQGVELDLHVIDNASPDGTGLLLDAAYGKQAVVHLLKQNVGFGRGHNTVLPFINSKYHAVINPDIVLDSDIITQLCLFLEQNNNIVAVTPKLLFTNGDVQHVAKRKPSVLALAARRLPFTFLKKYEKNYLMLDAPLSDVTDIQFCSGCFFVIRTDVFKAIGGFDEDYFMYFEDADITQRMLKHGRVVYYPHGYVYHAWHRRTAKSAGHFLQQLKSMFIYFKKWGFKFK